MSENALVVNVREGTGKGAARKLRASGRIPGIFYGRGETSVALTVDARALRRLLTSGEAGMNTLIDLKVDGGGGPDGRLALVRQLQRDPVSGSYVHADFYAVDPEHTIEVSVPIHLEGSSEGVKMGGVLDHALRELELECMPRAIPKEITLDVSLLEIGDSLHVRDLALPEGVALMSDPDLSVVSVIAPAVEEEPAAAEEGEAAGEVPVGEGEAAPAAAPESEEKASE